MPKISDFGLARASVTFTQTIMTDRVVGTAAYMAPEALRGEITPKSDIFSFGVVSRMFKAIYEFCFVTGKSVQNQEYPGTKDKITISDLLFLIPLVDVLVRKYFWTLICLKAFNYVDQNFDFANALSNGYL